MKIIEGLKKVKDLVRKAGDIRSKIEDHCSDLDNQTSVYADQTSQITEWLQSHHDIVKEIAELRIRIQRTNLATMVTIDLSGTQVTHCIAEWIHRRKDLADLERQAWRGLSDKNLRDITFKQEGKEGLQVAHVRRYFDPKKRDNMIEQYMSEPSKIDGTLEVINAVTDLM